MTNMPGMVRRPAGEALRILFNAEESEGTVGVVEMIMDPGMSGPPLHVHPTHAEAFYVVSGELSFQLGDEIVTGGPGLWACAPRNLPHTLANHSTEPGLLLCLFAPASRRVRLVEEAANVGRSTTAHGVETERAGRGHKHVERRFERMLVKDLPEWSEASRATRMVGPPMTSPS